jgi:hypothetical protein
VGNVALVGERAQAELLLLHGSVGQLAEGQEASVCGARREVSAFTDLALAIGSRDYEAVERAGSAGAPVDRAPGSNT